MALLLLALGLSAGGAAAVLCPSANHGGAFIGMASDTSSYTVTPAQDGRDDVAVRRDTNSYYVKVKLNPAQVWTLVDEAKPPPGGAVVHSFTGKYLQVLPDNGDNYNEVHSYESFVWTALEFRLKVPAADTYTLFVRWSGGDTGGAGDSMYATMANADGSVVRGRVDIHLFCDCVGSMAWSSLVGFHSGPRRAHVARPEGRHRRHPGHVLGLLLQHDDARVPVLHRGRGDRGGGLHRRRGLLANDGGRRRLRRDVRRW